MTGFVPRGCLTCVDALNETYQDMFGTAHSFSNVEWSVTFSDSRAQSLAGLKRQAADQMKEAVHNFQGQLFEGERTACWVSDEGLADIRPVVFGRENAAQLIACNGKIKPDLVGRSYTFFVRPKGYERSDDSVGTEKLKEVSAGKNRGGRPGTGRDAALVFWGMFPEGIDATETSWKAALREVNWQLERLGLKTVAMTALKENVNKLHPPK